MSRNNIVQFQIYPTDINIQETTPVLNIKAEFPEIVINKWRYPKCHKDFHMFMKNGKLRITDNNAKPIISKNVELYSMSDNIHNIMKVNICENINDEDELKLKVQRNLIKSLVVSCFSMFIYEVAIKKGFEGVYFNPYLYLDDSPGKPDIFDLYTKALVTFINSDIVE